MDAAGRTGQAGLGAQTEIVSGDEPGDLGQGGRSAEYGEQGQCRERAEPVAASSAAAWIGDRVQNFGQGGHIGQVRWRVGGGDVLQVAGEHVDRG
nr:hypothetical protein [Spongiactinospora rosea]